MKKTVNNNLRKILLFITVTLVILLLQSGYVLSQSINLAVKNVDLLGLYFSNISPISGRILVIASILTGIYTIYLAWKSPKQVYNKIKGKLAVAFLLEALFFL